MHRYWLQLAINLCGGRRELACLIGVKEARITYWLNNAKSINLLYATKIEHATQGRISRIDLVSELNKKDKTQIKAECEAAQKMRAPLTFKEKVELGLAHEAALGERQGMRNDLLLRENFPYVDDNSENSSTQETILCGRTEEIVAKFAGFGNYKTYQQAKKILKQGIPELIAVVEKNLPISRAAQIAQYSPEKQNYLLSLDRGMMIQALCEAAVQQKSKTSPEKNNQEFSQEKINEDCNRLRCLPTATWAMLSFVGIFQTKKNRRPCHEQDQNCETGIVPPRTIV